MTLSNDADVYTDFFSLSDENKIEIAHDEYRLTINLEPLRTKFGENKRLLRLRTRNWSRFFDAFDPPSPYTPVFVAKNRNRSLIFAGKLLLSLDLESNEYVSNETGRSDWLGELNFAELKQVSNDIHALVYECGVVVFNTNIQLLKFHPHLLNDKYLRIDDSAMYFEDENDSEYTVEHGIDMQHSF